MSVQYSLRTVLDYLYREDVNKHLRSNDLLLLVWRSKGTMEDKVVASNTSYSRDNVLTDVAFDPSSKSIGLTGV